jgi:four helix bundle protein
MKITKHEDLEVYQLAFSAAVQIQVISADFPKEERYSLTDQLKRSARSVCANLAEAFYKRRYPNYFLSNLTNALAESAETQVWLEFAKRFNYLDTSQYNCLIEDYSKIIGKIITMQNQVDKWQL